MMSSFKGPLAVVVGVILTLALLIAIAAGVRTSLLGRQESGLSSAYDIDLTDMARTDPNLLLFSQAGEPVPTGLKQSRALALDDQGRLHVLGDRKIQVYDKGALESTVDLQVDARCLFVTDDRYFLGTKDRIVEVYVDGSALGTWESLGEKALITSVAVNDDLVFIADAGQRIVWVYDHGGGLVRRIGDRDVERKIPGFTIPSPYFDLDLAPGGRLCVVNPGAHRIETYTDEGDLEAWWGEFGGTIEGFTGCCNPSSFAVMRDGRFVTCEKGLVRVKLYSASGNFLGVVAGADQLLDGRPVICETPEQCQTGGFDVATDRTGKVYVLDTIKNQILSFVEKEE